MDLIHPINPLDSSPRASIMKNSSHSSPALAVLAAITALSLSSLPCLASNKNHTLLEQSVVIKAPPKLVFEGIQVSRSDDPARRHLVSHHQDVAVIDEKLPNLPVIGSAHLVYREIEVPFKRIDYELVSSDKFKAFEGSWELTPLENGHETRVSLKSYAEPKMWAPFVKEMSGAQTMKDISRRLANLKRWCDSQEVREAKMHHDSDARSFVHSHSQSQLAQNNGRAKSIDSADSQCGEKQLDKVRDDQN